MLLAKHKKMGSIPTLVNCFVITPLFQSILRFMGRQKEGALNFLLWYVPSLEPLPGNSEYGNSDQRIFALYAHMTALAAKKRLTPFNSKGMEKKGWNKFMDWLGLQRGLMAWLTYTKKGSFFGLSRMATETLNTPFSHFYIDWKEINQARHLRFYERLQHERPLSLMPIRIPKEGILVDNEAYIFEGLAWIPRYTQNSKFGGEEQCKLAGYHALVLDDYHPGEKPVGGTWVEESMNQGLLLRWVHGDYKYWEEQAYRLFNEVLCQDKAQKPMATLGHLFHTNVQFTRYLRGSAAIYQVLDVVMRMLKELHIPKATKNFDCYALSFSSREFIETIYLKK